MTNSQQGDQLGPITTKVLRAKVSVDKNQPEPGKVNFRASKILLGAVIFGTNKPDSAWIRVVVKKGGMKRVKIRPISKECRGTKCWKPGCWREAKFEAYGSADATFHVQIRYCPGHRGLARRFAKQALCEADALRAVTELK